MDVNGELERLVALSEKHLQVTIDEQWDIWEAVAGEKKHRYAELENGAALNPSPEGEKHLHMIRKLEAQTVGVLKEKQKKVCRDLSRTGRKKTTATGYGAVKSYPPVRHFGVIC